MSGRPRGRPPVYATWGLIPEHSAQRPYENGAVHFSGIKTPPWFRILKRNLDDDQRLHVQGTVGVFFLRTFRTFGRLGFAGHRSGVP